MGDGHEWHESVSAARASWLNHHAQGFGARGLVCVRGGLHAAAGGAVWPTGTGLACRAVAAPTDAADHQNTEAVHGGRGPAGAKGS